MSMGGILLEVIVCFLLFAFGFVVGKYMRE